MSSDSNGVLQCLGIRVVLTCSILFITGVQSGSLSLKCTLRKLLLLYFLFVLGICSIFSASELSMYWVTQTNIDYGIFSLEEFNGQWLEPLSGPI